MSNLEDPWKPEPWEPADAYAVKALTTGTADAEQQIRALEWILRVTGHKFSSYRPGPDGDRNTAFAEGARGVGLQIQKLIDMPGPVLRRTYTDEPTEQI